MADTQDISEDPLVNLGGLSWLVFAAAATFAAGWGAYYRLGGIDTPAQKAWVVAAALAGLGIAVWAKKIVYILAIALVIILALWGANYWYFHK